MLKKLDHISRLFSKDMWRFGAPEEKPSDVFRRNARVVPFYEDDVVELVGRIGADAVLCGSDYPHPEGLAQPREFVQELEGLPEGQVRRVMRENFEALV